MNSVFIPYRMYYLILPFCYAGRIHANVRQTGHADVLFWRLAGSIVNYSENDQIKVILEEYL